MKNMYIFLYLVITALPLTISLTSYFSYKFSGNASLHGGTLTDGMIVIGAILLITFHSLHQLLFPASIGFVFSFLFMITLIFRISSLKSYLLWIKNKRANTLLLSFVILFCLITYALFPFAYTLSVLLFMSFLHPDNYEKN